MSAEFLSSIDHPQSGMTLRGKLRLLKAGDTLQPNDLYNSSNGTWETAGLMTGLTLRGSNPSVIWVRKEPEGTKGDETKKQIIHPRNPYAIVTGRRLDPGETIRSDDVRDCSDGTWRQVEPFLVGRRVEKEINSVFVRPRKD
ncbi:MAG: hypothetical protein KGI50_00110 [Patescibacteria group bacterium]|nr:hypothetical protein [Patescibacteria group bacterium]MDE2438235.1 hypothetical protein [Patescibacteria group bacterium]